MYAPSGTAWDSPNPIRLAPGAAAFIISGPGAQVGADFDYMLNDIQTPRGGFRTWWRAQCADLHPRAVLWTIGIFTLATAASVLSQTLGRNVTAAMVYLLGVTVIGATQGLLPGLVTAIGASAVYNFAIRDPHFAFTLADLDDLVPLVAFNVTALIAGSLAGRLRDRAAESQRSSQELAALLEASKILQGVVSLGDLAAALPRFGPFAQAESVALFVYADKTLQPVAPHAGAMPDGEVIARVSSQIATRAFAADSAGWSVFPLETGPDPLGVLLVRFADTGAARSAPALDAVVNMLAITLARCFLLERLTSARAIERSEAFKTALLSSVSHDMRTPLSAISASASGLLGYEEKLAPDMRVQLLTTITEQCERLNRYTSNLLNLSRAQGELSPDDMPVIDVVEVLGSAVNGIRPALKGRDIVKRLPPNPVFVKADAVLLEQVFHNVLENAVFYSDAPSTIEVELKSHARQAEITITDAGIGIPPQALDKVFERFYRVDLPPRRARGSGLGLAISKAFTEAVGGHIAAASPLTPKGGTRISIILPLVETTA